MNKLEDFLHSQTNGQVYKSDLEDFTKFDYDDETRYKHHLTWLLNNCYPLVLVDKPSDVIEKRKKRMGQQEFRDELFKIYSNTCVISGNICDVELEAAHIVPYAESGSYDLSNGLLLTSNFHKTFDKYLWAINPDTLQIEVAKDDSNTVGTIYKIFKENKQVTLDMNNELYNNLKHRYNKFIKNNEE